MQDRLIPSATVILLRDGALGLELLILKRNPALKTNGDHWVFPGGKLESAELELQDREWGERLAAARECTEECGLTVKPENLITYSRWVTPSIIPKRFDTGFYITKAEDQVVIIDNSEIIDYDWIKPAEILPLMKSGDIKVRPPTLISIVDLLHFFYAEEALAAFRSSDVTVYKPKVYQIDSNAGQVIHMLYQNDAGYEQDEPTNQSLLHRAIFDSAGIHYYRDNQKLY